MAGPLDNYTAEEQRSVIRLLVAEGVKPVSYTHLDVYKRQALALWTGQLVQLMFHREISHPVITQWLSFPFIQKQHQLSSFFIGPFSSCKSPPSWLQCTHNFSFPH